LPERGDEEVFSRMDEIAVRKECTLEHRLLE